MLDPTLYAPSVIARFEAKLSPGAGDCWNWTAAKDRDGYGHFFPAKGVYRRAHRWSYEYHVGPIPDGLQLDHLCRNRACVNPAHLEVVDQRTNSLRRVVLRGVGVRTPSHCRNGHEYTPENTYILQNESGQAVLRTCRACNRKASRRAYQKKTGTL